jgi:hypothetical protein
LHWIDLQPECSSKSSTNTGVSPVGHTIFDGLAVGVVDGVVEGVVDGVVEGVTDGDDVGVFDGDDEGVFDGMKWESSMAQP